MTRHLLQAALAAIVAMTPALVVTIAAATVRRQHPRVARCSAAQRRLTLATLAAVLPLVGIAFLVDLPSRLLGLAEIVAFLATAGFGVAALNDLDTRTRALREVSASARVASLRPRRISDYLVWRQRLLAPAIVLAGVAGLAIRLTMPSPDRRLLVPIAFAAAAAVFVWLYDRWTAQEITGPQIEGGWDEQALRARVGSIRQFSLVLGVGLMILAHSLLDLDWASRPVLGMLLLLPGAVLGVVGCARALSSDFVTRSYRLSRPG